MPRERRAPLGLAAVVLAALTLALVLWRAAAPPAGPVEPAWDRVACARCRMLVGEPGFAAQLHTPAGEVLHFDDPGCLLLYREASGAAGAAWFHDARGPGWLPEADARFVPAERTPMGHGLAAVAAREHAAGLDAAAALAALRAREAEAP
jgi:copper chaperone NosL